MLHFKHLFVIACPGGISIAMLVSRPLGRRGGSNNLDMSLVMAWRLKWPSCVLESLKRGVGGSVSHWHMRGWIIFSFHGALPQEKEQAGAQGKGGKHKP